MNINVSGEKDVLDGVPGKRQIIPVSELRSDTSNEGETSGAGIRLEGPSILQVQQQKQPKGTVVCWERFLPVRSIRVLLVENDDSTRHIVAALLRNCNYEVMVAGNGLQAWKILEELTNHIDLVLTEVVMPYLPGIPLLNKIMSHKTRKNIPVIMMSSHDSMGLVFKCLSNGAVDFLVKPIRKNELKNLWQHVWRRCHSSSGSGSESGTQTNKSVKSKTSQNSNNSSSDDRENDGNNNTLLDGDGSSDDGSGAQNSSTRQAAEVDSSKHGSPIDQVAECADSTCAQVIRSNTEHSVDKRVHSHARKQTDTVVESKDFEILITKNVEPKAEDTMKIPLLHAASNLKSMEEFDCTAINTQAEIGQLNPNGQCLLTMHKGDSEEITNHLTDGREFECNREAAICMDSKNKATNDSRALNFEHTLKRLRGVDTQRSVQDDRFVVRRSEQSAFSRYNTSSNILKALPNGSICSSSEDDNSVKVIKRESVGNLQAQSSAHLIDLNLNAVDNDLDTKLHTNRSIMIERPEATNTNLHPSASRHMKNDLSYASTQVILCPHSDTQTTNLSTERRSHQEFLIEQSYHNHNNHNQQHFHNLERQSSSSDHGELSVKMLAEDYSHCGSRNTVSGRMDGNQKNYSLNRNSSGRIYGQNGNTNVVNAAETNSKGDVGQVGKRGNGEASGSGSGNREDEDKLARRLAALDKFRQKKKDRCFIKKVRYQNRQRLAEQRPRVRGQFVKRTETDE